MVKIKKKIMKMTINSCTQTSNAINSYKKNRKIRDMFYKNKSKILAKLTTNKLTLNKRKKIPAFILMGNIVNKKSISMRKK